MTPASLGHLRLVRRLTGLVRDPACGAGALLLPPLRDHLRALVRANTRVILAELSNVVATQPSTACSWAPAGLEVLDREGVLAALVPTSFTAGRYFSSLRAEMTRVAPLRDATFVALRDGVFAGVLPSAERTSMPAPFTDQVRVPNANTADRDYDAADQRVDRLDADALISAA